MKLLGCLALGLCLIAGDAALAAAPTTAPAHHVIRRGHAKARLVRTSLHRRVPPHHLSPLARLAADGGPTLAQADTKDAGWIRDHDHAGVGWNKDGKETVLGVYRRPDTTILGGPDIVREGRGAAGVSVSIPLGH